MMSPGEIVAIVRDAVTSEAPKWRKTPTVIESGRHGREQRYNVYRAGYAHGDLPSPLVEDGAIPHAITVHQHKTAREADEIIREAAWAAAVKALEAKGLK